MGFSVSGKVVEYVGVPIVTVADALALPPEPVQVRE
jgi:hypothetical protein